MLEKDKAETTAQDAPYLTAIMPRGGLRMSERESHKSEPSGGREFSTEEALEIESDRWRRVVAAFLQGADARAGRPSLRPWRGVVGGIGLTVGIGVVVGVVGVASATLAASGIAKPSPTPAVTVPASTPTAHPGAGLAPTPSATTSR